MLCSYRWRTAKERGGGTIYIYIYRGEGRGARNYILKTDEKKLLKNNKGQFLQNGKYIFATNNDKKQCFLSIKIRFSKRLSLLTPIVKSRVSLL